MLKGGNVSVELKEINERLLKSRSLELHESSVLLDESSVDKKSEGLEPEKVLLNEYSVGDRSGGTESGAPNSSESDILEYFDHTIKLFLSTPETKDSTQNDLPQVI